MKTTDVIRRPLITEKTSILREDGRTIVFHVAPDANKVEIKRAHQRGATVLFSSHSLADIEELCDSFTLLHRGEIRYVGGASELRARTGATTLDAAFLKALEGPLAQGSDGR